MVGTDSSAPLYGEAEVHQGFSWPAWLRFLLSAMSWGRPLISSHIKFFLAAITISWRIQTGPYFLLLRYLLMVNNMTNQQIINMLESLHK